jgi:hypothetical protein
MRTTRQAGLDEMLAVANEIESILDAIPEGPGLSWVDVWDREPTEEDGDRQGNVLWASYKSVIVSPWNLEVSAYDKWLSLSAIPFPADRERFGENDD